MKIPVLLSLVALIHPWAIVQASPIHEQSEDQTVKSQAFTVPLTRDPRFKHNTLLQIQKIHRRYGVSRIGTLPIKDVHPDLEYYGTVSVGTPAQPINFNLDTKFMDNAIANGLVSKPVVSVFMPSIRQNGGVGGEYRFGEIDSSKYRGDLVYVPVTKKGYWQVAVQGIVVGGKDLGVSSQGIIDTGTTLILVSDAVANLVHQQIPGAIKHREYGWMVPCSIKKNLADKISFRMGGQLFDVAVADLAYEEMRKGGPNCFSGVQGGMSKLWILGDVFIKNNYCVFEQSERPRIGMAPLRY
ncbi:hypothetical protein BGW38_008574 [Lunasporangiospora selenospora]|uniref:Peptidase A1 domain-containing protein n=1 Tax=Lunasporangiospora selenospora TaxID=979761 RepID=A0A9P6FYK1_9FUNG|nr:hypothetical protein BGW38_008574 [Lunasporangiospora selenospora]